MDGAAREYAGQSEPLSYGMCESGQVECGSGASQDRASLEHDFTDNVCRLLRRLKQNLPISWGNARKALLEPLG